MMKTGYFLPFIRFSLIASLLLLTTLAACAPAEPPVNVPAATLAPPTPAPATATSEPALEAPTETATEAALELSPVPAATSRGPDLHATDPSTVSLASGGLQFVEFFRFT